MREPVGRFRAGAIMSLLATAKIAQTQQTWNAAKKCEKYPEVGEGTVRQKLLYWLNRYINL